MDANRAPRRLYYPHRHPRPPRCFTRQRQPHPNVNHISNDNRIPNASAAISLCRAQPRLRRHAGGERQTVRALSARGSWTAAISGHSRVASFASAMGCTRKHLCRAPTARRSFPSR